MTDPTDPRPCTCPPPAVCRRCGQCILDGRLTLFVEAVGGDSPERIDCCQDCAGLFAQWFMRRPAATAPLRDRLRVRVPVVAGRRTWAAMFPDE